MDVRISVEEASEIERNIQIEIPRGLYDEKFFSLLGKAAKNARIKGFRPGKAPKDLVEKMYGDRIKGDVLGEIIQSAYSDAVSDNDLTIVGQPTFDIKPIEDEQDICAEVQVSLFPEPKIENYFNEAFDVEVDKFDESVIEKEVAGILERFVEFEPLSDKEVVEDNDFVKVDFEGTVDGESFPGSSREDAVLEIGADGLPNEFSDALTGAKLGEVKETNLTFPEEHNDKKLAGKVATYKITLKEILEKKLPEFTDEIAKKTGLGDTVEEVRSAIEKKMSEQIENQNQGLREARLFEVLIEKNSFEVPQVLIDEEIRGILFEFGALDSSKRESFSADVSHFRESLGEGAEKRVRQSIILTQIVAQEGLEVADEELESWLDEQSAKSGMEREDFNTRIRYPQDKARVKSNCARQKMVELLLEKASITETIKESETDTEVL